MFVTITKVGLSQAKTDIESVNTPSLVMFILRESGNALFRKLPASTVIMSMHGYKTVYNFMSAVCTLIYL